MYKKPGTIVRVMNAVVGRLAAIGLGPSKSVVIDVRGRRSGHLRATVINTVKYEGQQYLVAPRGETEWVQNVRAADGNASLRRGRREKVKLEELPVEQRAPVIMAYLAENAMATKGQFGIEPDGPIQDYERIAPNHPVFRFISGTGDES